ncbi:MAG: toll/interleukin-1 receptor domain-containing protein [Fibrobacteraceae bacterium]|nr:toll/interleukin-1 receptor domain-containing protein [Fibrobacteraceae bacterium]
MWDLFISHASEDKEALVRPLAEELVKYGLNVWYDEFSLELGDSLTTSIDKGLIGSKFGLLIISPAFFQKRWTEYELKSLLTKEINGGKVILPIWHNVTADFVASKSLFLADKKAIASDVGIKKLAYGIVKVVRPEIISSYLLQRAFREIKRGEVELIELGKLKKIDGVRYKSLPQYLVIASRFLSTLLPIGSWEEVVTDFARDASYDDEFIIWIAISCAYIDAMRKFEVSFSDKQRCNDIFSYLLYVSLNFTEYCEKIDIDNEIKMFLLASYQKYSQELFSHIKNINLDKGDL